MAKNQIEPNFEFEKKIGIADIYYGDIPFMLNMIGKLLYCMKETNKIQGKDCEFLRLDFRQSYLFEGFPMGSLILDLKWGCKTEKMGED